MCRSESCEIWRKKTVQKEAPAGMKALESQWGYGVFHGEQEGQCAYGLVSKVGADGHELRETERGQIVGHGDEFDLILCPMEVKALQGLELGSNGINPF